VWKIRLVLCCRRELTCVDEEIDSLLVHAISSGRVVQIISALCIRCATDQHSKRNFAVTAAYLCRRSRISPLLANHRSCMAGCARAHISERCATVCRGSCAEGESGVSTFSAAQGCCCGEIRAFEGGRRKQSHISLRGSFNRSRADW